MIETLNILAESHPFITAALILTIFDVVILGIVCAIDKNAKLFASGLSDIVLLWILIGIGYFIFAIVRG